MLSRRLVFILAFALVMGVHLFFRGLLPSGEDDDRPSPSLVSPNVEEPEPEPEPGPAPSPCDPNLPIIQILLPVTSGKLKPPAQTLAALPLFKYAFPSIVETVEPGRFRYMVSLGADKGDPWYDNPDRQQAIRAWVTNAWQKRWGAETCPLTLTFHAYDNTRSRPTWVTNYMTQVAYEMGVHYFYRINDDTVLQPNQWSSMFVNTLASFRPIPGLGSTGPFDPFQKGKLLTMSFVGRLHLECFGTHFPYLFGNYYADDWIQNVYANVTSVPNAHMMQIVANVSITHMVIKSRYDIKATPERYRAQLETDRQELDVCIQRLLRTIKPRQ